MVKPAGEWQSSIVDFDPEVDPARLHAHDLNARRHPEHQRQALRSALSTVGWVDAVKVNTRTGSIVDGHARVEEALEAGVTVPVLWVDLTEDQERYVLATLDPIGALATYDAAVLSDLLSDVQLDNEQLESMLTDQVTMVEGPPPLEDLADEYQPPSGDGDGSTEGGSGASGDGEGVSWLRLEVGPVLCDQWRAHRAGFDSDTEALEYLFDR